MPQFSGRVHIHTHVDCDLCIYRILVQTGYTCILWTCTLEFAHSNHLFEVYLFIIGRIFRVASERKLFLGPVLLTLFIPTVSLKLNAFFLGRFGVISGRKTTQSKEHWPLANLLPAIKLHNPCKERL